MKQRTTITDRRVERIRDVLSRRQKDLTLILANIHDSHNVSAVLRSCDAFGVPEVHLYYTTSAFPALGKKTSASAGKWVTRKRHTDAQAMISSLRSQGCQILATGFSPGAKALIDYDLTLPTAIIFGNEHSGVDEDLKALVPDEVYIPMQGMVQSLNVSVAAAVTLYEAWRQRHAAGMYDTPSLSEEQIALLEREWREK